MSVDAATQPSIPKEKLISGTFTLSVGKEFDLNDLTERLIDAGYVRSEMVEGTGQFALRGGILDIFTTEAVSPVRIEFWGDEIDSISFFDTETQRRTDSIDSVDVTPACEVVIRNENLIEIIEKELKRKNSDQRKTRLNKDLEEINAGVFSSYDRYIPFIFDQKASPLEYVSDNLFIISESSAVNEHLKNLRLQLNEDIKRLLEEGLLGKEADRLMLSETQFYSYMEKAVIMQKQNG
jgi:transcription-repair coupling factor (superfamily II helicase)